MRAGHRQTCPSVLTSVFGEDRIKQLKQGVTEGRPVGWDARLQRSAFLGNRQAVCLPSLPPHLPVASFLSTPSPTQVASRPGWASMLTFSKTNSYTGEKKGEASAGACEETEDLGVPSLSTELHTQVSSEPCPATVQCRPLRPELSCLLSSYKLISCHQ